MEVFNVPSGGFDIAANDNRTVFLSSPDNNGSIYLRNDSTAAKWRKLVEGGYFVKSISSNLQGVAYTSSYPGQHAGFYPFKGTAIAIGGSATVDIAVGALGDIWMVNTAGKIYLKEPSGSWIQQQGTAAKRITVTGTGRSQQAWMANSAGKVYRASWNGNYYQWTQMAGSSIVDIAAGTDGTVWCCNTVGKIYKWNGTGWTQLPGSGAYRLTVGGGSVWMMTMFGKVYRYYYK